jgi:hypothetical protein
MPKISARLQSLMDQQHGAGDVPRFPIRVKYNGDADKLIAAGLLLRSPPNGGFATGSATAETIRRLAALENVEVITEPHHVEQP